MSIGKVNSTVADEQVRPWIKITARLLPRPRYCNQVPYGSDETLHLCLQPIPLDCELLQMMDHLPCQAAREGHRGASLDSLASDQPEPGTAGSVTRPNATAPNDN
jgi:hypothetical protein